ncbi:MAG: PAS domain S-box protein [Ferruginibacter sp.]|nr:PAS domain S-box protein [Ferruginibacter sp.]
MKKKNGISDLLISAGDRYINFVKNATSGPVAHKEEDIFYWREFLFTKFITYLLPTSLIALVPGVFMSLKHGYFFVAFTDLFAAISVTVVSLNAKLSLAFRRVFVVAIFYLLAIALLIDLSLLGPGIVYLLALSVVITIMFPRKWGYWSVLLNFLICILCAFIIHLKLFNSALIADYSLGAWIAVSSNVLFLSFVIVVLLNATITGFKKVISAEYLVKKELETAMAKEINSNILLTESESHFRSLFFKNPSCMWLIDENLHFLLVNEATLTQYGYTNDEFLSMNISDIKAQEDADILNATIKQSKPAEITSKMVVQHRRKNQELFFAEVVFHSLQYNGRPATLAISQNITEQLNYIKEIEKQNEKFKEIAWMQSHEVRGPLATIMGITSLLADKSIVAERLELIQGLVTSSNQLDVVIKEIVKKSAAADKEIVKFIMHAKPKAMK